MHELPRDTERSLLTTRKATCSSSDDPDAHRERLSGDHLSRLPIFGDFSPAAKDQDVSNATQALHYKTHAQEIEERKVKASPKGRQLGKPSLYRLRSLTCAITLKGWDWIFPFF